MRASLRNQGLTDHQVRVEMQRRRDEQPTPTILDIAQQTAALLGIPTVAPTRRVPTAMQPTPMRHPAPTQQPAPAHPAICQAKHCGRPASITVYQTSGNLRRLHVCTETEHILAARKKLERDGTPVRAEPIATMKPRPPQCVFQGCNYPASDRVVQRHPDSQGITGVQLTVCVAHIDAATTHLGTCNIETLPNAPAPVSA